jgi:hypothetical protein
MIVEIVPVLHIQSATEFFEHKSEFKMEERVIICDHCTVPFEDWSEVIFHTYNCGCSVRICTLCKDVYDGKSVYGNKNERETIHGHG